MIPAEIVDDHNDALGFYYKLIARNKIPFEGLCLVHFDSHPDLAPPDSILTDKFSDRRFLLDNLTISDWILPGVYMGHFSSVVWLKPPWASQIPAGDHKLVLGKNERGLLVTSSTLAYYVSDLSHQVDLADPREFDLHVIEVGGSGSGDSVITQLETILQDKNWCLDIDLDFYSTQNPFKGLLGNHFSVIHDLFRFREFPDFKKTVLFRKQQLVYLEQLCKDVNNIDISEMIESELGQIIRSPNFKQQLHAVQSLVARDEYITDLFYIGQQTELPHHLSTPSQISLLIKLTGEILDSVGEPCAITLARSEYDEYSTPETLEGVQREVVGLLRERYKVGFSGVIRPGVEQGS